MTASKKPEPTPTPRPRPKWTGDDGREARAGCGFAVLIVLVALNLRAFLTASSPLLADIRAVTGLGFQGAALLTVLPMLTMGPMSLLGVAIGQRLGGRAAVALGLATIALACASRYVTTTALPLLGSAVLAGLGVGLVQALMPAIIKRAYPERMGMVMGLYSAALMGGGGLGAVGSPWVARLAEDWRTGLAIWALPAMLALLAWSSGGARPSAALGASREDSRWLDCFRSRRAWLLAGFFGLLNGGYTSLVAWLPPFFAQQGWTAQHAGSMLALMTAAQLVAALLIPVLARGRRDLRSWLAATLSMQLGGFGGLMLEVPSAVAVVVLLGVGLGGAFALCMVLAMDHLPDATQAGTLSAFMQGIGFMIAAVAPFVTGGVREHSGSFGFAWGYLALVVVILVALTVRFDPRRYARATRGLFGARPGGVADASRVLGDAAARQQPAA